MAGSGTKDDPWQLTTANGGSQYQMWRDEAADPPTLRVPGGRHAAEVPAAGDR